MPSLINSHNLVVKPFECYPFTKSIEENILIVTEHRDLVLSFSRHGEMEHRYMFVSRKNASTVSSRAVHCFVAICFLLNLVLPAPGFAQALNLPQPGMMLSPTPAFRPALMIGIEVYPDNPFKFDFIINDGDDDLQEDVLKNESEKMIKYFLASLTIPEKDLWVNLSPYEKDRILPDVLAQTDLGRDLLAQDYILKQLTASLIHPETDLGKKFWDRVYQKAYEKYQTTEIPVDTFNKVWIMPDKVVVYRHGNMAFVAEASLKVMLEEDYLALQKNQGGTRAASSATSSLSSEIVREIVIPELTKEVNTGKNFASLRQAYNALILGTWFKKNLRENLLGKVYVDRSKVAGIEIEDKAVKQKIYDSYLAAYKQGAYNLIRTEYDTHTNRHIPRKYFSGGIEIAANIDTNLEETASANPLQQKNIIGNGENSRVTTILSTGSGSSSTLARSTSPWEKKDWHFIFEEGADGWDQQKVKEYLVRSYAQSPDDKDSARIDMGSAPKSPVEMIVGDRRYIAIAPRGHYQALENYADHWIVYSFVRRAAHRGSSSSLGYQERLNALQVSGFVSFRGVISDVQKEFGIAGDITVVLRSGSLKASQMDDEDADEVKYIHFQYPWGSFDVVRPASLRDVWQVSNVSVSEEAAASSSIPEKISAAFGQKAAQHFLLERIVGGDWQVESVNASDLKIVVKQKKTEKGRNPQRRTIIAQRSKVNEEWTVTRTSSALTYGAREGEIIIAPEGQIISYVQEAYSDKEIQNLTFDRGTFKSSILGPEKSFSVGTIWGLQTERQDLIKEIQLDFGSYEGEKYIKVVPQFPGNYSSWKVVSIKGLEQSPEMPSIFKADIVKKINLISRDEREEAIRKARYCLFNIPSDQVFIDLLTDSGTGAISDEQAAAMMRHDESYAGSQSYARMENAIKDVLGFPFVLPTHQGRAAENIINKVLVTPGRNIVLGNPFFDTTAGHISANGGEMIELPVEENEDLDSDFPFKGNIDLAKLRKALQDNKGKVAYILMTITDNLSGGQPVSLENLKAVRALANEFNVPLLGDIARFAENSYFIKEREPGYQQKSIREIVRETMSVFDAVQMSAKKDTLTPMGGFIATRNEEYKERFTPFVIYHEGFLNYGGISGKDMEIIAQGIQEVVDEEYLKDRISQARYLGTLLHDAGVPVRWPIGGHGVFVDGYKFFNGRIPKDQFPAQVLGVALYEEGGIRGVEIGSLLKGRKADGTQIISRHEFLRLAIPRRVYTRDQLKYVADVIINLYRSERKNNIPGLRVTKGRNDPLMHFTAELEPVGASSAIPKVFSDKLSAPQVFEKIKEAIGENNIKSHKEEGGKVIVHFNNIGIRKAEAKLVLAKKHWEVSVSSAIDTTDPTAKPSIQEQIIESLVALMGSSSFAGRRLNLYSVGLEEKEDGRQHVILDAVMARQYVDDDATKIIESVFGFPVTLANLYDTAQVLFPEGYAQAYYEAEKRFVGKKNEEKPEVTSSPTGGIDFATLYEDMNIKTDAAGSPLPVQFQDLGNIRVDRLAPIIIQMTPMQNLPFVLGFEGDDVDVAEVAKVSG